MQDFQLLKEKNIDLDNLIDKIRYCLSINGECQKCESRKNSKCSAFCDTELLIKAIHRLYKENEQLNQEVKEWTKANDSKMVKIVKLEDQIDELKEKIMNLKTAMINRVAIKSYDSILTIPDDVEEIFGDAYESEFNKFLTQAVKDTAKEIYGEIDDSDILVVETQEYGEIEVMPMERLKEIIKSKGVEVE